MNTDTVRRIPRPIGVTIKAKEGRSREVHESLAEAFIRGLFPMNGGQLSIYKFAEQYRIPVKVIEAHVKDGLAHSLISDDGNLADKLEAERLKMFSSSLFRIGSSDRVINQLIVYLAQRVLGNPAASSFLIKELNSTLNSQVKLTETSLKAIGMMNDALATVIDVQGDVVEQDEVLLREEIMTKLEAVKENPDTWTQYLKGVPEIHPVGSTKNVRADLHPGSDSYIKKPDTRPPKKLIEAIIIPQ